MARRQRWATLVTLAICATVAVPAGASTPPRPQIVDGKGDTAVPSQDVLSGLVTATRAGALSVHLELSSAPLAGVPVNYIVVFYVGCHAFVLEYAWKGAASLSSAALDEYACATGMPVSDTTASPTRTWPAAATPTASGVTLATAQHGLLRYGVKVYAAAITETAPTLVVIGTAADSPSIGGDVAYSTRTFRLGS